MPSYQEIRESYQTHLSLEPVIVDHYAKIISPFLTKVCLKWQLIPNQVTILMMISGVVGAGLFALPPIHMKVFGLLFIHLWYVLDCSDGEVARITKRFSKFGKEIDFTAHVVNHPLFNMAFAWSLLCLGRYNGRVILFLAIISISAELVLRNILAFYRIHELVIGSTPVTEQRRNFAKSLILHTVNAITLYPNFALVFPVFYIADYFLGTSMSMICFTLCTVASAIIASRASIKWIKIIVDL